MRYKLDENGYVIAVSFGGYLDDCTEYTGTIPIGYNSLGDWATYSCVNAYYIDHDGNLALDQEKLAEIRRKEAQDKVDYAPLVRKDLYESEELLESQYIKATAKGQTITLTDAKVLPPVIVITDVDTSAYQELTLYIDNGIGQEKREYTILLDGLESVSYIAIANGLVVASINGNEEVIGSGHVRLFEGECNIYASEVVTIEIEYYTNVQDVDSLKFLQGKSTDTNKFKILEDGSIEAHNGKFSGRISASSFEATGTITKHAKDYTEKDITTAQEIAIGTRQCTPEYLEKYDLNADGIINALDLLMINKLVTGIVESYTIDTSVAIDPLSNGNIIRTKGVAIRPTSIMAELVKATHLYTDKLSVLHNDIGQYVDGATGSFTIGDKTINVVQGIITSIY